MPIVAGHSGNVAMRVFRALIARWVAIALLIGLFVAAIGNGWVAATSRGWLSLPPRGSTSFSALAMLDPSIETKLAVSATNAVLADDPASDRATELLRLQYAQLLTIRALSDRPLQPKLWLLHVALLDRFDPENSAQTAASMKMVFFTSSGGGDLIIDRLRAALKLKKLADAELSDLVRADIATLVLQRSDLQSKIVGIYHDASTTGQIFLLRAIADLKPELLPSIR